MMRLRQPFGNSLCVTLLFFGLLACRYGQAEADSGSEVDAKLWPVVSTEAKPGAYWWWMGSAVDKDGIRWNLEQAAQNGIGTLHIIPIYGVQGNEANEISFLSPKWLEMLDCAVREGAKLGVNIDMTLGTGWCFGGPGVADEDSATLASFKRDDAGRVSVAPRRKAVMVKRAAPGGEGPMLDPFSLRGIKRYTDGFEERFATYTGLMPRAFYHDSYEYRADWSDGLYAAFEALHGYRLQDHLDVFVFKGEEDAPEADRVRRVKADYRRTLADMHFAFTKHWTDWTKARGLSSRNEAHGSPADWLDIYALADIPETEFFRNDKNPVVAKFASSAAHVGGRTLVSSESGTWADEHYNERLGALKVLFDGFFLSGVNHLFYHGMIYSPVVAPWPGWAFYASTEMNPRNTIWKDAKYLNEYIARVQSVLQAGKPDNDILLLWTLDEPWHRLDRTVVNFSIHNATDGMFRTTSGDLAEKLWKAGLTFDYVSPRRLKELHVRDGKILAGHGEYKILLVPELPYMTPEVFACLLELKDRGAELWFDGSWPKDVPGFAHLEKRRNELNALKRRAPKPIETRLIESLEKHLGFSVDESPPCLGRTDLKTISRRVADGRYIFTANIDSGFEMSEKNVQDGIDTWYRLPFPANEVVILDPMTGKTGKADWRQSLQNGEPEVRLQLRPNQSLILRLFDKKPEVDLEKWVYCDMVGKEPRVLKGRWKVDFLSGGPTLPESFETDSLRSWTDKGGDYENFSGTAKYSLTFDYDSEDRGKPLCRLNLGPVCDSATIKLNGHDLGGVFCAPMVMDFPRALLEMKDNLLEIEVTNRAANRIRYMDKAGISWKIFKDINIVDVHYQKFDASTWPILPAGLTGPVSIE
ncbi:MAG TPA: hypothetical protein DEB39_15255 [Planctomycetaceae bacterium]|nr:hypothetical protein [Planctomycetaceae bacterium]